MKLKECIVGVLLSFMVTITFWTILIVPARPFIALTMGFVTFFTYRYVVSNEKELKFTVKSFKFKKVLVAVIVLSAVLGTSLVHPTSNAEFIPWENIPITDLLSLLSALLLLFFPGYAILNLLDKGKRLAETERILFSFLTDLFLLPFLGVLSFALGSNIQNSGTLLIILLNLALLLLYVLKATASSTKEIAINLDEKLILSLLFIFMLLIMLNKYSMNLSWDYGDLDVYYGFSLSFTKSVYPLSILGPGQMYPFWLPIFLAQSFVLAGLPYVNAFQSAIIPITLLPILSFYVMAKALLKTSSKKLPIIATMFGFFGGGFGWLFGLPLVSSSQTINDLYDLFKTTARTDSGYLAIPLYPLYTLLPYFVALSTIFALIWLIYSDRAKYIGNIRYVLVSIAVSLGYLTHVAETVLFTFVFFSSIVIIKRNDAFSYRKSAAAILFGLLIVALPDAVMSGSIYVGMEASGMPLYYGVLIISLLAVFLSSATIRLATSFLANLKLHLENITRFRFENTRILRLLCTCLIVYLYFLSFIILSAVYESNGYLPTQSHTVPWYAWPSRLGICGLIALPGTIYLIWKNGNPLKKHLFLAFLIPVFFLVARILHVYPSSYYEDRLTSYILIPTIMLATYTLLAFHRFLRKHVQSINIKNFLFGLVLSVVLIVGFLPPLFVEEAIDFNYWSQPVAGEKLSHLELEALNFLRLNTAPNSSVLTVTSRSQYLLSYAGLFDAQTFVNKQPSIIFGQSSPETTLYSLTKSQVKYIYLASVDARELDDNPLYSGFVGDHLLEYLPIAFQNEEVTIYEIPAFSTPMNSSTALVTPNINIGYFKDMFDQSCYEHLRYSSVLTVGDIITIKTNNQSENHDFELPVNINPNQYNYAAIRWKTDGSELNFYLLGSATVYYIQLGYSTDWQRTVINLDNFYDFFRNEAVSVKSGEQILSVLFRDFEPNSEYALDYIQFFGFQNNDSLDNSFALGMLSSTQTEYSTVIEGDPARFNFSTLILNHDLNRWSEAGEQEFQKYLQWTEDGGRLVVLDGSGTEPSSENRNLTQNDYLGWSDENFTTGWTATECSAWSNGTNVRVEMNNESKNHDFISPTINITVCEYPFVVLRWKTDSSPLFFYPHGTQSDYRYIRLGTSTEWTTSVIDLRAFYDFSLKNNTAFNDQERIDKLLFRDFMENATYQIGYVGFYKMYPLPICPGFANLLSIYAEGMSAADGIRSQTFGFDFSSVITVPLLHSNDANTKLAANYTLNNERISPYALSKRIGNGEVIYVAVSPYFSALKNSTGQRARDLFRDAGSLLNALDLGLSTATVEWSNRFPQFDFVNEPVNFTGIVTVDTDYVQLPKLNATQITILSNNGLAETMNLNNSIVEQIEYDYPVKFKVDASEAHLFSVGLGNYLDIKVIGDFNLTVSIPKNNALNISILRDNVLLNETFHDTIIQLSFHDTHATSILAKNPTITIEGKTFFNGARIYRNHYKMPLFYDDGSTPFEVIGNTKFTIEYSDNGASFVDNFTFDGEWFRPTTAGEGTSFTEMDIPWLSVLASPFHFLLVGCVIMIIVLIEVVFHKKIKSKLNLRKYGLSLARSTNDKKSKRGFKQNYLTVYKHNYLAVYKQNYLAVCNQTPLTVYEQNSKNNP